MHGDKGEKYCKRQTELRLRALQFQKSATAHGVPQASSAGPFGGLTRNQAGNQGTAKISGIQESIP